MNKILLKEIKNNFYLHEHNLSKYAFKSVDATRLLKEEDDDIRPVFYRDIDRVIHSVSYTRYMDKTQVFSFSDNDFITKRILHVQLVSKISRTIARALRLNEDLCEAVALGHDIGHTPLGHLGEYMLNKISLKYLNEMFNHNIQSVRTLMYLEKNGRGSNISVEVLDGIMCHNGEIVENIYEPKKKTVDEILKEYELSYTDKTILRSLRPTTLEGCVVRISDLIAYLGRDIEDAINLKVLDKNSLPIELINILGKNNKHIVNTIILDIIENSYDKPYIKLSDKIFQALFKLKEFNYHNIYSKAETDENIKFYERGMNCIFERYLNDLKNENKDSEIYKAFLNDMDDNYITNNSNERKVIDFIAGMTDDYFLNQVNKVLNK